MENQEEEKRQLHKLLLEFNANSGTAGFVCSRPVELMPKSEQERIIGGFCNASNINILSESKRKLELAKNLNLDPSEASKVNRAIPILNDLIEVFNDFLSTKLNLTELRQKVRKILYKPIPEDLAGLKRVLTQLVETVEFLATQPLETKDNWDRMIDCVQMYDVLGRTKEVCKALQSKVDQEKQGAKSNQSVLDTLALADMSLEFLESYFKEPEKSELLQEHFTKLATDFKNIWADVN